MLVAGGLLMGTLGVFITQAGQHPLTAVFFRCGFGALALLAWATATGRLQELRPSRAGLKLAATTGALMTMMWVTFFAAIGWTSIALATVTFHLQPLWVLLAGAWLLREGLSVSRAVGVLAALLGLALATGLLQSGLPVAQPMFLAGLLLAVLGSLAYAVVSLLAKQQRTMSALALTFWQCTVGGLMLCWWPAVHGLSSQWVDWSAATWAWLAGLGVLHTGLAYVLMFAAMQRLHASRIAVLQFVYPISAILLDVVLYGRTLLPLQSAGVLLMGLALWWAGREAPGARR